MFALTEKPVTDVKLIQTSLNLCIYRLPGKKKMCKDVKVSISWLDQVSLQRKKVFCGNFFWKCPSDLISYPTQSLERS